MRRLSLHHAAVFFLILFGTATTRAVTLDWDTATWTSGSTTGSSAGVDVNITASNPGLFRGSLPAPNPPTPAITRAFDGGLSPGEKTLELSIDLPNNGNTQFVTVTFTFNAATYVSGVSDVMFTLFDIDAANDPANGNTYQDRVFNISATTVGGATITPTISNLGSAVTNTGGVLTGIASVNDLGAGSSNGNAQINFGGSFIRSITFSYGGTTAFQDPTYQHIGIHDMTFTPVPEINPALSAVVACLLAGGLIFRHRAALRK